MVLKMFTFNEPNPPRPFRWFKSKNDELRGYSVRPERRGNGVYWYMRKRINGKNHTLYLGPTGKLSAELLDNAVAQLEANAQ